MLKIEKKRVVILLVQVLPVFVKFAADHELIITVMLGLLVLII